MIKFPEFSRFSRVVSTLNVQTQWMNETHTFFPSLPAPSSILSISSPPSQMFLPLHRSYMWARRLRSCPFDLETISRTFGWFYCKHIVHGCKTCTCRQHNTNSYIMHTVQRHLHIAKLETILGLEHCDGCIHCLALWLQGHIPPMEVMYLWLG